MTEPFIGAIQPFGFYFAPRGWATCQGQLLSIAQNTALFSLLGTTYGGNGQTTFGLPDLQGRMPIGQGNSTAGGSYSMGEVGGSPNVTLTTNNMPMHTHTATGGTGQGQATLNAYEDVGSTPEPTAGGVLAAVSNGNLYSQSQPNVELAPLKVSVNNVSVNIGVTGGSMPFSVQNPFLVINYCIALEGIFPSRN